MEQIYQCGDWRETWKMSCHYVKYDSRHDSDAYNHYVIISDFLSWHNLTYYSGNNLQNHNAYLITELHLWNKWSSMTRNPWVTVMSGIYNRTWFKIAVYIMIVNLGYNFNRNWAWKYVTNFKFNWYSVIFQNFDIC